MKHPNAVSMILTASAAILISAPQAIASEGVPVVPDEVEAAEVREAAETASAEAEEAGVVIEVVEEAEATTDAVVLEAVVAEDVVEAAEEPVEAEATTDTRVLEAEVVAQPVSSDNPISMDRSDWPAIVVTPEDGSVAHNPHYMGNVPLGEDIVSPLHAPDPVWQIQEALRGAEAGNLSGENLSALGAQPFIGLAQFALIPFRAVIEHPWSDATSP
jgi:hypothetical protein